jgi:hypothetical protein
MFAIFKSAEERHADSWARHNEGYQRHLVVSQRRVQKRQANVSGVRLNDKRPLRERLVDGVRDILFID